ncbi:MAG TPA: hypothetical protein VG204_14835 [Terriglobia bacterium]|nr:hypothetical protein [Terriglobia bacterium]
MSSHLKSSPKIWKLASDLGLKPKDDAVREVVAHCKRQVIKTLKDCQDFHKLLDFIAATVGTVFEEVHNDSDLFRIKEKYLRAGETGFATLENELHDDVFGITFKRQNAETWEKQYISIIDCRGNKAARRYFTKWHEIAHLLTLTPQLRLCFRRTHVLSDKDPEEALMDVIAGELGFLPELIRDRVENGISFEEIQRLHDDLCPDASFQSSVIGFAKAWPQPCVLVEARLACKRGQEHLAAQGSFEFSPAVRRDLRAVKISMNDGARKMGLRLFPNMRVPPASVISTVFRNGENHLKQIEDLSWWEASGGFKLCPMKVRVEALRYRDSVLALIVPL